MKTKKEKIDQFISEFKMINHNIILILKTFDNKLDDLFGRCAFYKNSIKAIEGIECEATENVIRFREDLSKIFDKVSDPTVRDELYKSMNMSISEKNLN